MFDDETRGSAAAAAGAVDWDAVAPRLLSRASAQGRRDGLAGRGPRAFPGFPLPWPAPPALLLAGFGQCYAAGLRHGQEVRQEQARRRARAGG
jgi:hypothetical protein